MARPRTIKLDNNGEVVMKNVSEEVKAKIEALLKAPAQEANSEDASEAVLPSATQTTVYPLNDVPITTLGRYTHVALSTFQDEKDYKWKVAVLKFDPRTGLTKLDKVVPCGMEKIEADERFRILAVQQGVIG